MRSRYEEDDLLPAFGPTVCLNRRRALYGFAVFTVSLVLPNVTATRADTKPGADRPAIRQGQVVAVHDANQLLLRSGDKIRLADIQAPRGSFGRNDRTGWPLADKARAFVRHLVHGQNIRIEATVRDRYNRLFATIYPGAGSSLQHRLLAAGLARVYPVPGRMRQVIPLLKIEQAARAAGKGIWRHEFYRVRDHREAGDYLNSYQLVRGRVQRVAVTRRRVYLNFGHNWREDFTIVLSRTSLRRFDKRAIDIRSFEGRIVRVRGWLFQRNGPMIRVYGPGQIELLPAKTAKTAKKP